MSTALRRPPTVPTRRPRTRIDGLDGLRALAVVAVLLYHADVPWARGGFVGVDVFFVLSGYLVTSIVVARFHQTGGLGFRRFWSARLRRLAPAQLSRAMEVISENIANVNTDGYSRRRVEQAVMGRLAPMPAEVPVWL